MLTVAIITSFIYYLCSIGDAIKEIIYNFLRWEDIQTHSWSTEDES